MGGYYKTNKIFQMAEQLLTSGMLRKKIKNLDRRLQRIEQDLGRAERLLRCSPPGLHEIRRHNVNLLKELQVKHVDFNDWMKYQLRIICFNRSFREFNEKKRKIDESFNNHYHFSRFNQNLL